jgi:hypothetical protein
MDIGLGNHRKAIVSLAALVAGLTGVTACGGAENSAKTADSAGITEETDSTEAIDDGSEDDVLKFDEEAAEIVLERSRRKAVHCSSVAPETPQTEGEVYVTFDGPKGRSVEVKLSVDFQVGSDQGQQCIKNAFMGEYIPPFEGNKTITYKLDLSKKD